jgi:hypothetical protein
MIYTVASLPQADDELAVLYMQAANPRAISAAANRIERALKRDADWRGVLLDDDTRLYIDPLSPLSMP